MARTIYGDHCIDSDKSNIAIHLMNDMTKVTKEYPSAASNIHETPPAPLYSPHFDRLRNAILGQFTWNLSPISLAASYLDWAVHIASSPAKQVALTQKAWLQTQRFIAHAIESQCQTCAPCIEPLPQDRRFRDEAWQAYPFNLIYQAFLLTQQWWHIATTDLRGVSRHHEEVVTFAARQLLDVVSPSNFPFTNPEVLRETWRQAGANLIQGAWNWREDWQRQILGKGPVGVEAYRVGENIATTAGKVVYRNHLIELIQYAPTTKKVYSEPVLIVPSWIMKYYILDLSPRNSLVKSLVDHGHTVFMISWRNPDESDRDLGMDDYLQSGPVAALDAISQIIPERRIHAVGYCLGGTLMAIAAAWRARQKADQLASLTLLAAQTDFEEPGELGLFIDESQIAYLEDIMWDRGYLDGTQMAGTFQLLNSRDLIWSKIVHEYLIGRRQPLSDLMAWNADSTRLPYRMHSEHLRRLYLNNELAHGQYCIDGKPIVLTDIRAPLFVVSTVRDHVSPWRSVYKIHLLTDTEVTFVLTTGGHNAGIVSEPGHKGRSYQLMTQAANDSYIGSDAWQDAAPRYEGSWWPAWEGWLTRQASAKVAPPTMGNPAAGYSALEDAPGSYVFGSARWRSHYKSQTDDGLSQRASNSSNSMHPTVKFNSDR